MNKQELLDNGWNPEECRIGTLYFIEGFFCRFKEPDKVTVFSIADDMNPLGVAETIEELESIQKNFYKEKIIKFKSYYEELKKYYEDRYNEKLDI